MTAYDPLPGSDSEHDEGNSVASSIEAPPFALGHDDDLHLVTEQGETRNLQPSGEILVNQSAELAASRAMSSVTTQDEQRASMLRSQLTEHSNRPPSHGFTASHMSQQDDDGMETYIFDTTESLLGSSQPSMMGSSHLPGSGTLWTHDSTTPQSHSTGSLDFSTLMRQADDRHQSTTIVPSRMPTLQEDLMDSGQSPTSTNSSNLTRQTTNQSSCNNHNWLYSLFCGSQPPAQQQQPLSAVPLMSLSPSYLKDPILSSAAGRNIQAKRLGENTFEVSMQIDPPSTVRDVMDVIGNPDLLRLWCDPIQALVITKSSEGAQSATNRSPQGNREYEGEWIEATTSTLVSPSKHSSCIYSLGHLIYTSLGFPSYGKITLFVERLRGQVGLTIGPFSGGIVASHTIKVQDDGPVVSVVDKVRLSRDEESCLCCCGLCEPLKRCFMPRMVGHMDQVVSSMMRLRVLVEHGEAGTYAPSANPVVGYEEEAGVSRIPLLS
jgi:hypothetical protein